MSEKIAIIGSGEMAVIIADEAKKMGITTHSFSNNPSDKIAGHSDMHHNIDIFNIKEIVAVCKKMKIDGVLPTTELTIDIAAQVANELELNGMTVGISSKVTDKGFIRNKVSKITSIKQPSYLIWEIGDEIPVIKDYPLVVKPTEMGGKRGISIVETEENLNDSIKYAINSMPNSKKRIILEDYIPTGKEYSIESLSYNGTHYIIQITEKITSGPPEFVELGHIQPAKLSEKMKKKIETVITEILTVVGIDNTTTHTEIKIHENKIFLIELNARSGGDHIASTLTELSTGYSYIQGAIQVALGQFEEPDISNFKKNSSGVIFVTKQTEKFKPLFDECENFSWLYKKNKVTDDLKKIINNQAFDTNYMIYKSEEGIPIEINNLLKNLV